MACLAVGMVPRVGGDLQQATFAIDAAAELLCAGLDEDQLSWRPQPHCWSIAENLAHLRMTSEALLPPVDSAIAATQKLGVQSDGPSSLGLYGRIFVWSMGSTNIIKMRAPEALRPQLHPTPSAELEFFLACNVHARRHLRQSIAIQ
jgi:hypothetical protein